MKEFANKLKDLGIKVVKKVEEGIGHAKNSVESTILTENLRHRFHLENPYRFIVCEPNAKPSLIQTLMPQNAKRYEEDDTFVFFGSPEDNRFRIGDIVTDIADQSRYEIRAIESVLVPVMLNDQEHEVKGTAVSCKAL
jgi:hypothetical protein